MKCARCDEEKADLKCDDCSTEMWTPPDEDTLEEGRDEELEDVLEFMKQKEIDAYRCGSGHAVDSKLGELRLALERGEHRR